MAKKTPKNDRFETTERVTKVQDPATGRITKRKTVVITKKPGASTPEPEPTPPDAA